MAVCERCGKSWASESAGEKCPFCGYAPGEQFRPRDMAEAMKYLIEQRGVEILLRQKQFYALLADILPEHNQEKSLVRHITQESTCYQEMSEANQKPDEQKSACMGRNIAVLETKHFMSRENAVKALVWLAQALEWNPSVYADFLNETAERQGGETPGSNESIKEAEAPKADIPSEETPKTGVSGGETPKSDTPISAQDVSVSAQEFSAPPVIQTGGSTLPSSASPPTDQARNFVKEEKRQPPRIVALFCSLVLWGLGIFTILTALSSLTTGNTLAGILLAGAALLVIPPVNQEIRKLNRGSAAAAVLFIALWVAWFVVYPSSAQSPNIPPDQRDFNLSDVPPPQTDSLPPMADAGGEMDTASDYGEGGFPAFAENVFPVEEEVLEADAALTQEQQNEMEPVSPVSEYLYPTDREFITRADLEQMSREEISYVRNEIFARYGYVFINEDIQAYFNGKSWYHANPMINASTFNDTNMTPIEQANLDTITAYEKERGWRT